MKLPRILTLAVLGVSLTAGAVSADDPVLEPPTQWSITYYYTNDAVPQYTGAHYSPCYGLPYWDGNPGPVEHTVYGDC